MRKAWLIIGLFLLVSCTPNEADFKSKVPVTEVGITQTSNPQPEPVPAPIVPSAPQPEKEQAPKVVPPSIPQPVPPSVPEQVPQPASQPITQPVSPPEIPSQINLNVPFFPQAPDGDWGLPWQEACEEASSTLAVYYATGKPITKDQFKTEILGLVDWENKTFSDYKHTSVNQTAQMIQAYFGFSDFEIVDNPTVNQMKAALAKGSVIVAPFSGKDLKNPFYSNGGPMYHMMVIRGYDSQNFITNDVGTKRGENFIYSYGRIMETIHDWNATDIHLGAKKIIVVNRVSK